MTPALSFAGIGKSFGARRVLDGVDLDLHAGEIHALLGENGAGKTTLVRMALGLVRPDAGGLRLDGRAVAIGEPRRAAALGIGMVHQHFTLADGLTVAENLALAEDRPWGFTRAALERRAREQLATLRIDLDPRRRAGDLAVGERQRLEIAKALRSARRVLILDEPTAVLAPGEVAALFAELRALAAGGLAILLITHKLDEALAAADRVTVLRGGRVVLRAARPGLAPAEVTRALFGEEPPPAPRARGAVGKIVAAARALRGERFGPIDLDLRSGELVAIFAVGDHGQSALVETLARVRRPKGGFLSAPRRGVAFVGGDRRDGGLALDLALAENVAVAPGFLARPWFRRAELEAAVAPALARFGVKASGPWQPVRELSGGNQQRVVLARELSQAPALVLAENPARGLDLRAAAFVRAELRGAVARGASALVSTSDLDEALALGDRLLLVHRGRLHPCQPSREAVARAWARLAAEGSA